MGYRCAIVSCKYHFTNVKFNSGRTVKFYSVPKDVDLRTKWIEACKRNDIWNTDNFYICSEHFQDSDFERDLKSELMNLPPKKILKLNVVPTRNLSKAKDLQVDNLVHKRKTQEPNKENKENAVDPNLPPNNYMISYLGVPRLLITADGTGKAQNHGSQSKIISIECSEDNQERSGVEGQNTIRVDNLDHPCPNKNVFRLDELCRLCGSYSNRMKPIFDSTSEFNYSQLINFHFPDIKISKDDILPVQICARCETNLVSWYQFYRTCNAVNRRFRSILKKLTPTQNVNHVDDTCSNSAGYKESDTNSLSDNSEEDVHVIDETNVNEVEIVEITPDAIAGCDIVIDVYPHENSEESVEEKIEVKDEKKLTNRNEGKAEMLPRLSRIKKEKMSNARRRRKRRMPSLNLRRMCHICGKIFKYPESLRRHLKTVHSDERPFKCHLCTSSFNRNHNLTIHIKVVHQRQRIYVKKHVPRLCDYCGKVLLSARSLEEHISSIHTKKVLYECNKCHSPFYRKLLYDRHKSLNDCDSLNRKKRNAEQEVFLKYCEICGLEFKKEHFYLKHQELKHVKNFVCSVCAVKFEDAVSMRNHIDAEHPEIKPFDCGVCGKKFKNKALLNCHLIIHSGEKRYQCQYCSLRFLKKKYLTTHILTHTGERPFICTICGKGFKQSGDMRKHKATHIRNNYKGHEGI